MSEKDYTQLEVSESLRQLCKERGKRIEQLQAQVEAVPKLVNELDVKWDRLTQYYGGKSKMEIIKMRDDIRKLKALKDGEEQKP